MPNRGEISFRSVCESDFPLLLEWLKAPHVAQWWDCAEIAIKKIEKHIEDKNVWPFLTLLDGDPFGYLQICSLDVERNKEISHLALPTGTMGFDQLIGPEDKVGKGLGPRFMDLMIKRLFDEGVPVVLVDPHPNNIFAIRAYEKAGFERLDKASADDGQAQFMIRYAQEF